MILRWVVVVAALGLGLLACAPREVPIRLELVTRLCDGTSALDGVTHLQFRITGEGIDPPVEFVALSSSRELQLPQVPAGLARRIEVRGFDGAPTAAGRLVSRGVTSPFNVPAVMPLPGERVPDQTVFLRPVDRLAAPNLSVAPEACQHLAQPRAGHTASVLPDGRVLIAGGYRVEEASGVPVALAETELFDPRTGVFIAGPPLGVTNAAGGFTPTPRAFHAATALPDDRLLLTGGESYDSTGIATRHATALVFDPARDPGRYGGFPLRVPRAHHATAADLQGRVLIVGGVDSADVLVPELEWWGGDSAQTQLADQSLSRLGMSVAALPDGAVAVAGGQLASGVTDLVQFFIYDEGARTFTSSRVPALLTQARRAAPVVPFATPDQLLVLGGFGDTDEVQPAPLGSSELLQTTNPPVVLEGPAVTPRGSLCAVPLGDGRILTVGGRGLDINFSPVGSDAVEVMTPTSSGGSAVLGLQPLPVGRFQHSCTLLPDGTVLVLGGLSEDEDANTAVLGDAWVITPRPRD
ncbi:MAG: kelch motif-containing protein [Myxococcota bacterium]|nr:kelch motif-containing protein [Myxococcota bacterium]